MVKILSVSLEESKVSILLSLRTNPAEAGKSGKLNAVGTDYGRTRGNMTCVGGTSLQYCNVIHV